jgi:hypothetical protein
MNQAFAFGATQIPLVPLSGTTFPTLIKPPAGCCGGQMKLVAVTTGATIQILPNQVAGISIGGATAVTGLGGYPLVTGEMYPWNGPAAFWLAASGASATVAINFLFTAGATLL